MLRVETEFVGLKIYFIVVDAFSMDSVLLCFIVMRLPFVVWEI
jgi:hypothetical protein